jgi:hypothetical protein
MAKVAKSGGSKYSFKERSEPVENASPVGTNYKRVKPQSEINSSERENFWVKEQEEEKKRKAEERKKLELTRKRMEEEEKEREAREAKKRENEAQIREIEIMKRREAEKNAENKARSQFHRSNSSPEDESDPEFERQQRAEKMRQERAEEAKSLIGQRSMKNARAMFEQNTSVGQLSSMRQPVTQSLSQSQSQVKPKQPAAITVVNPVPTGNGVNGNGSAQHVGSESPTISAAPTQPQSHSNFDSRASNGTSAPQNADIASPTESVHSKDAQFSPESKSKEEEAFRRDIDPDADLIEDEEEDEDGLQFAPKCSYSEPLEDIEEEMEDGVEDQSQGKTGEEPVAKEVLLNVDHGLCAKALYDYQAADETEISFDPDEIITHIEQIDDGWWQGMAADGSYGLFPANYVQLLSPDED